MLELIQCNSLQCSLLEMHEPPDCSHTCCTPETPHSRSCKGNSWAVWEFYKHQHLLFWLLYSYSMYKPCLIWKDTSFHVYFSSTLSFEIFSPLCMVFLYTALVMQGLNETFGDIPSIMHTLHKYSKWTLFVQLKTLLMHTTTTCFWQFPRHDCLSCFSTITRRRFQLSRLQERTACIFQCSRRW